MDDQRDKKSGIVNKANSAINTVKNLRNAVRLARTAATVGRTAAAAAATSEVWIPVVIIVVIVLIVLFTLFILLGHGSGIALDSQGGSGSSGSQSPGGGSSQDIASCTFYRDGEPEMQIGNPEMAQFIESVSAKVGVPAAVVAGIIRVESGDSLRETDPAYFATDYDSHPSSSDCCFGIGQFSPATFEGTFNQNSPEMFSLFQKNQVRSERDPRNNIYPDNYLRIYSIKDSIIATAFKVKQDKLSANGDGPWDRGAIDGVVRAYYGCLAYPPPACEPGTGLYNYGEDVWNSFSNCKAPASPINITITCPIDPVGNKAIVTCGTFNNPVNLCGHGNTQWGYDPCSSPPYEVCPYSERLKNAIDVISTSGVGLGLPIFLPAINGTSVQWSFSRSEFLGSGWGWEQNYNTQFNGHSINLELTHLNEERPPQNVLSSGSGVGTSDSSDPHLHIGVVVDGVPVDPLKDLFMCTHF